jgi:hypothetical protein
VSDVDPSLPQTFFVNDRSQAGDQTTTAIGNNRNTGTTADDPRMNPVSQTQILGPATPGSAWIDRANPYPGAKTIDIIGALGMVLKDLTLSGAYTGLHVRDGSHDSVGERLTIEAHTADGLDIEGHSHDAILDELIVPGQRSARDFRREPPESHHAQRGSRQRCDRDRAARCRCSVDRNQPSVRQPHGDRYSESGPAADGDRARGSGPAAES